jgi:hypothetical protein
MTFPQSTRRGDLGRRVMSCYAWSEWIVEEMNSDMRITLEYMVGSWIHRQNKETRPFGTVADHNLSREMKEEVFVGLDKVTALKSG